ncbi:aldolase/citrate lyase family protein [Micromonospora sp. WMMD714]|uniref:HpcH/HpaI aldolase family protein n=1 Tax=Micromonospora sp. WMMD714 TaxID=3016097 RepID=UPI00249B6A22|nr:aldolase/citrate lyase family protein [Micromonospora sp. WMMD714]WFE65326.1 aldolase/citrate lyase family protein [Micromonospora sp. WMMD714]
MSAVEPPPPGRAPQLSAGSTPPVSDGPPAAGAAHADPTPSTGVHADPTPSTDPTPSSGVHAARARLRGTLRDGGQLVGTFVKLPGADVIALAARSGLDFVVIDLEHSGLDERTATDQLRLAALAGLPALVRVPAVDPGQVNRLLEAGAVGVQLSTVRRRADVEALRAASRYAPHGRRSISLAHPSAGYGGDGLDRYLAAEAEHPPVLVAQIETATTDDPLPALLTGVDVGFVGTTDLAVSLGLSTTDDPGPLLRRTGDIADAARTTGAVLGGWIADRSAGTLGRYGLTDARYLVVGSDLQLLGTGLRRLAAPA